ncbi:MAG: glutamate--cysteine ligase [bacterium]|nr:glutamate--cysteine ligase [bacterium]
MDSEAWGSLGQEIEQSTFEAGDYERFRACLARETLELEDWQKQNRLADGHPVGGLELEAWLVHDDPGLRPKPCYDLFYERMGPDGNEWLSPELALFNVEFNTPPAELRGGALRDFAGSLEAQWRRARTVAGEIGARLLRIGILPVLQESDLCLANISRSARYAALNEQILRARDGQPLHLNIVGLERLEVFHADVMLEAAATSFQIHMQAPAAQGLRLYNASIVASAPLIALAANSPYLFGRDLWEETRIPVFEEAVEAGGFAGAAAGPLRRVSFGSGFARESLLEVFQENLEHFPILLPVRLDDEAGKLHHLRFHNGTIWRWNRPLIGFDQQGRPHIRVEQRVLPAGPTILDEVANMAFYFGLVQDMVGEERACSERIEFACARDNFYGAARHGLKAHFKWYDGEQIGARRLILNTLLPRAARGLASLGIDAEDARLYLGVIEQRATKQQTGAGWQRRFVEKYGRDMQALTGAYLERQDAGAPVHSWDL